MSYADSVNHLLDATVDVINCEAVYINSFGLGNKIGTQFFLQNPYTHTGLKSILIAQWSVKKWK